MVFDHNDIHSFSYFIMDCNKYPFVRDLCENAQNTIVRQVFDSVDEKNRLDLLKSKTLHLAAERFFCPHIEGVCDIKIRVAMVKKLDTPCCRNCSQTIRIKPIKSN